MPSLTLTPDFDYTGLLTVSGNEITDALRALGVQGDGLSSDSSFGVWAGTTNLVSNGSYETDLSNWIIYESSPADADPVLTRETLASVGFAPKFGSGMMRIALGGGRVGNSGARWSPNLTHTVGLPYTASAWVRRIGGSDYTAQIYMETNAGNFAVTNITVTETWKRVSVTITPTSGSTTMLAYIWVPPAAGGVHLYVDGYQVEQSPIPTPFAVSSRSASRVQAPATLLDETQGWVSVRFRPGWDAANTGLTDTRLFEWGDDANNLLALFFQPASDRFLVDRRVGGTAQSAQSAVQTFLAGEKQTVAFTWDSTQVKVGVNGGAFVAGSAPLIPALAATQFDIGRLAVGGTTQFLQGDVLWFAYGKKTLTDSEWAQVAALGDSDVYPSQLPGDCVAVMPMNDTSFRGKNYLSITGAVLTSLSLPAA